MSYFLLSLSFLLVIAGVQRAQPSFFLGLALSPPPIQPPTSSPPPSPLHRIRAAVAPCLTVSYDLYIPTEWATASRTCAFTSESRTKASIRQGRQAADDIPREPRLHDSFHQPTALRRRWQEHPTCYNTTFPFRSPARSTRQRTRPRLHRRHPASTSSRQRRR